MPYKIIVADDHEIIHEGIFALADKYIPGATVRGVTSLSALRDALAAETFDLVILDINMPNGHSLQLVEDKSRGPGAPKFLIFSALDENTLALSFFEAGALGFIHKGESFDETLKAIHSVLNGHRYMSDILRENLLEKSLGSLQGKTNTDRGLTLKEAKMLTLLKQGKNLKEVAAELGIGVSSVYAYRRRIMEKLGARNELEFVRLLEVFY